MKKILILHTNMELGGAETSLLGLLQSIDYTKYEVSLMLFEQKGELLPLLPKAVKLLTAPKQYQGLVLPIKDVLFKLHLPAIASARLAGKILGKRYPDKTYATKQAAHRLALPFLPKIKGRYDMAISFIDPHYIVSHKVNAGVKLGWLHTDFSRISPDKKNDYKMWNGLDYVVNVSESCKKGFDSCYSELASKSIVVENILAKPFVVRQAEKPADTLCGDIRLLSIGRFSNAKNFDNVPEICSRLNAMGLPVKWYIIGYGGEEPLIRQKIAEFKMEDHVIILGKKDNPYPYIKACDVYVQPSRYEGKCVAVREAQMLAKPVVITDYATSASQLEDEVDGIVVPMDNQRCAEGIAKLLKDKALMKQLSSNCAERDYSNAQEVEKLFGLMEYEN